MTAPARRGRRPVADRPLEIIAVLMLGVATLGSAWCGYQATRWNSEESDLARDAATLAELYCRCAYAKEAVSHLNTEQLRRLWSYLRKSK